MNSKAFNIITILVISFCASCTKEIIYTQDNIHILDNHTDKYIVYEQYQHYYINEANLEVNDLIQTLCQDGVGKDSLFYARDTLIHVVNPFVWFLPEPLMSIPIPDFINKIILYNCTDTTSYSFTINNVSIWKASSKDKKDALFLKKLSTIYNTIRRHSEISYSTTIDAELLQILTKDYSMLEKFPEYYVR